MSARLSVIVTLIGLLAAGCGADARDDDAQSGPAQGAPGDAGGKQDSAEAAFLASLEMINHEIIDGEQQTFRLVAEVSAAIIDDMKDGETLTAELWLLDGDADPSFRITTTLTFHEAGIGAFLSETVDASAFLPWRQMQARLISPRGQMDFVFQAGEAMATEITSPERPMTEPTIAPLEGLEMFERVQEGGEKEQLTLLGYLRDPYLYTVADGHTLKITVWASDGAADPSYTVEGNLVFVEDGLGGYISSALDTSALLPWGQLTVQISGELEGAEVDQRFTFTPGDLYGAEVLDPQPAIELLKEIEAVGLEIIDGEAASLRLAGEVAAPFYDAIPDGHTLMAQIAAADGAADPDFFIEAPLVYVADGLGGYITDVVDISALLPFQALSVRVLGDLDGAPVDQRLTLQ